MSLSTLEYSHGIYTQKANTMTEQKTNPKFISVSQAERLPECQVTRRTLIRMIDRNEVPEGHYQIIHLDGGRRIVQIDEYILPALNYRGRGEYDRRKD